jgi:hypothetical protein
MPNVKKRVGTSGLCMKNLPKRNIPARPNDGSRSEMSIRKMGLPKVVVAVGVYDN